MTNTKKAGMEIGAQIVKLMFILLSSFVLFTIVANFSGKLAHANEKKQTEQFRELFSDIAAAKDNEPTKERHINLAENDYIYAFNTGTLIAGNKQVKKPNEPDCNAGPCVCICDKDCNSEEADCRSIDGISQYYATSSFGEANKGGLVGGDQSITRPTDPQPFPEPKKELPTLNPRYTIALHQDKDEPLCIRAERENNYVTFSACGKKPE